MKTSTDRILTSHVGSLPRSQEVVDFLFTQDRGEPYDQTAFDDSYDTAPLDLFEPMVRRFFSAPKRSIYVSTAE